ncbi:MAG: 50S ribosomal protein L29 [bacterium]|nr:50S ribosomal protein L29 [bacterium]
MKQEEISKLSAQDLQDQISNRTEQLHKMKLGHAVSPMENPLQIRHLRRSIARLKTELTKRQAEA